LGTTASAATSRHGIPFDRTVDAVDDLGLDPTGSEPVDAVLSDAIESDTLIQFPPGEYLVTDTVVVRNEVNFGVQGTGSDPSDVQFVFPDGNQGATKPADFHLFNIIVDQGALLENFEIHQTEDEVTGAGIIAYVGDGIEFHDLVWQGFNPISQYASGTCLNVAIETRSGVGRVSGIDIHGGGVMSTYPARRMGLLLTPYHVGELRFSDLDIRELGSTAFRATACSGAVRLRDSYFENNDNGAIRFGGGAHPSKQSSVKNCQVVVDDSRLEHLPSGEAYEGVDGIRLDATGNGWTGALVEDCGIRFESLPSGLERSRGAIARPTYGDHGAFTVRDTTIRLNCSGVPAVSATRPGSSASAPHSVTLDNVHVTGTQTGTRAPAVFYVDDSDGSTITDCCLSLPDTGLDGVRIDSSDDCLVSSTDVLVGGDMTDFSGSSVETENITDDGACRVLGGDNLDRSVTVESSGDENWVEYRFSVSGDLAKEPSADGQDTVDGSTATGGVADGGEDAFKFNGEITDFSILDGSNENVTVYVDGEKSAYADSVHTLTVESVGSEDWTTYEFTASEDVRKGELADSGEEIDGTTASGGVAGGGLDSFEFVGEITTFTVTRGDFDDIAVYVDGEERTFEETDSHTLKIESVGSESKIEYEFTVSGDLEKGRYANGPNDDQVDGSTATGAVGGGGHDTYRFDGDLTDFSLTEGSPADAAVYVDGERVSFGNTTAHKIKVESVGSEGRIEYEFTVSGDLEKGRYANGPNDDQVDGSTATGAVGGGGYDTYEFGGDLTDFTVTSGSPADAAVYVDGERVSFGDTISHELKVESVGSESKIEYEFTVSGDLEKGRYANGPNDDQVDGSTATGAVGGGGYDTYEFGGDLTDFTVTSGSPDDAAVYVDGTQVS
jgi:hypothetical protein